MNNQLVLDALRKHSPISRPELAAKMGLPRDKVSQAVDRLIHLGWVARVGPRNKATYVVVRDGQYIDGRGKGPNAAWGRSLGPKAGKRSEIWPMPPMTELERVWPTVLESIRRAQIHD
jgi:hypothetical protein